MTKNKQIQKLTREPDWRAALFLLMAAFAGDARVWQHVNLDREEIAFRKILDDGTFSSGEKTLLSVAASLFSQEHRINLWEVFSRLDDRNAGLVLGAIRSFINEHEL